MWHVGDYTQPPLMVCVLSMYDIICFSFFIFVLAVIIIIVYFQRRGSCGCGVGVREVNWDRGILRTSIHLLKLNCEN